MGLDSVELVMRIEETFDIRIPDSEVEKAYTVGDLYEIVWKHVKVGDSQKCVSQKLFYELRNSFSNELGVPKSEIKPKTLLNDVLPVSGRYKLWTDIERASGYKLPELLFSSPYQQMYQSGLAIGALGIIATCVMAMMKYVTFTWLLFFVCLLLGVLSIGFLFKSYRNVITQNNFRDFTYKVLAMNAKRIDFDTVSRKDMETIINYVISDSIGLELEEVSADKSFVKDLGVN